MKYWTPQEWQIEQRIRKSNIVQKNTEDFDNACMQFRQVCNQIKQLLGLQEFKGGFDQMAIFQASEKANTIEGIGLAMKWSALNQLCKYQGNKLGYGQPQWWYKCWENN